MHGRRAADLVAGLVERRDKLGDLARLAHHRRFRIAGPRGIDVLADDDRHHGRGPDVGDEVLHRVDRSGSTLHPRPPVTFNARRAEATQGAAAAAPGPTLPCRLRKSDLLVLVKDSWKAAERDGRPTLARRSAQRGQAGPAPASGASLAAGDSTRTSAHVRGEVGRAQQIEMQMGHQVLGCVGAAVAIVDGKDADPRHRLQPAPDPPSMRACDQAMSRSWRRRRQVTQAGTYVMAHGNVGVIPHHVAVFHVRPAAHVVVDVHVERHLLGVPRAHPARRRRQSHEPGRGAHALMRGGPRAHIALSGRSHALFDPGGVG